MDNASCVAASEHLQWKAWTVKHPWSESIGAMYLRDCIGEKASFPGISAVQNPAYMHAQQFSGLCFTTGCSRLVCVWIPSKLRNAHFFSKQITSDFIFLDKKEFEQN